MKFNTLTETASGGSISTGNVAVGFATSQPKRKSVKQVMLRRQLPKAAHNQRTSATLVQPVKTSKAAFSFIPSAIAESAIAKIDRSTTLVYRIDQTPVLKEADDHTASVTALVSTKLDHAQRQHMVSTDKAQFQTSMFGLEDSEGNIVRVTVKREQAAEFERRLNDLLASSEDSQKEVAEIIYMMRDDFDILDVDWAQQITEDVPKPGSEDDATDQDADEELDLDSLDDEDPDTEEPADDKAFDIEDSAPGMDIKAAQTMQQNTVALLQQVVDLLKKETAAKASEAELITSKNKALTQDIDAKAEQRELERQIELANVEDFEDRQRGEQRREKLVQRIARYRASVGETGRSSDTPSAMHPADDAPMITPTMPAVKPADTTSPTQPDRRDPPPAIKRRLQNRGFNSL